MTLLTPTKAHRPDPPRAPAPPRPHAPRTRAPRPAPLRFARDRNRRDRPPPVTTSPLRGSCSAALRSAIASNLPARSPARVPRHAPAVAWLVLALRLVRSAPSPPPGAARRTSPRSAPSAPAQRSKRSHPYPYRGTGNALARLAARQPHANRTPVNAVRATSNRSDGSAGFCICVIHARRPGEAGAPLRFAPLGTSRCANSAAIHET